MKENTDDKSIESTAIEKVVSQDKTIEQNIAVETADEVSPAAATAVRKQRTPISKLAIFAIILILMLASVVGYSIYYYLTTQHSKLSSIDELATKQATLELRIEKALNTQSQKSQQASLNLANHVDQKINQQAEIQSLINKKIADLSGRRPNDWLLAEANYLVTLAGRKLWQEHDAKTATSLLVTADKRIGEMNDQSLISLRMALAKDIATLAALPQEQSQNIALAIDGLIAQIDNLKLNVITLPESTNAPQDIKLSSDDSWQDHWRKNWNSFIDSIVKVRKHEGSVIPLMAPNQQWYLEENLKNKLIQAQLAVYRQQQQAFVRSIELSHIWVLQFFDREDSATLFMIKELDRLQKLDISVNYPRDLLSRNMIGDELVRRHVIPATTLGQK